MHAHPCVGWFELCSPRATRWDAAGPSWVKLGLAAAPGRAELRRARLGVPAGSPALGHVAGCQWGSGLLGTCRPHACPSQVWGVPCLQGKSSFSPAQPEGPLGPALPQLPPWKG